MGDIGKPRERRVIEPFPEEAPAPEVIPDAVPEVVPELVPA